MFKTIGNEINIRTAVPTIDNPLDGVTPSIDVFGVKFTGAIQMILGGVWALALILLAGAFIWNLMKWGIARNRGHSDDIEDGAAGAKKTGIAFGAAAGASVIIGGILALATAAGA
ncbi:hypothetical protein [Paenarthrobacter nitroguajacolicus]|uniref:hypothetical protein n=1 Tax=Paenarthrobacter nitroguajacolicus TaxID=211146 RepID=UPI00285D2BBF|nr:hypothetical protein [Paenarthrobacter nitroguajacolicus]MDR6639419.1 hypothetical protein [Paenarthrobacter nitroguajacolicus]